MPSHLIVSKPVKRTYWIAVTHDVLASKYPVVHYGYTDSTQVTESGQPEFEVFDDEKKWKSKLNDQLKVDPDEEAKNILNVQSSKE
jgi:hypothetical protein